MTTGTLHSIVVDHDTTGARTIGRANNPAAGIVVAQVPPELGRRFELGWAVLEALGKSHDVSGAGRNDDINWEVLTAWLVAYRCQDLVLLDAQWLPEHLVADAAGLVAVCGLNLWLVAHHPVEQTYLDTVARWPHRDGENHELVKVIRAGLATGPEEPVVEFPGVPTENWPTFRHAARQVLDPDAFEAVDAAYRQAFKTTRAWFATTGTVNENSVVAHLRDLLATCVTSDEMLTRVRGAQAAAFLAGWLVSADLPRLVATAGAMSQAAAAAPRTWARLGAYRQPYRCAAVALAAVGHTVGTMLDPRCGDVAADGSTVTGPNGNGTVPVPDGAQVFLRAQATHRAIQGATGSDRFLDDETTPRSDRGIANALRAAARELAVPVPVLATGRTDPANNRRWRNRWGVSVQELR